MDKKMLAAISPRFATAEEMQRICLSDDRCYHFHAAIHANKILVLTVYHAAIAKKNCTRPYLTVYFSKTDFINVMYVEEENQHKWYTSCLWRYFPYHCSKSLLNMESKQAIAEFFGRVGDFFEVIDQFQQRVLADRLAKKHQKIFEAIDKDMALVPALPKRFEEYVATQAMPQRYIFYDYAKRKILLGFCTNCRKHVAVDTPRHNQTGVCPACGATVKFKARGKLSHPIFDECAVTLPQKVKGGFILRHFETWRTESTEGQREVRFRECRRTLFLNGEIRPYVYDNFKQTGKMRWCHSTDDIHLWDDWVFPARLDELTTGTAWQYSSVDLYRRTEKRTSISWYLYRYLEWPYMENLLKNGLHNLVYDSLHKHSPPRKLYTEKTKIHEMLGISKDMYRMLKEIDGNRHHLEMAQTLTRDGFTVHSAAMLIDISDVWGANYKKYVQLVLPYTSFGKAMRYSKKLDQNKRSDWLDYAKMAAEVGYDMRQEHAMFPRDLKTAHSTVTLLHREMAAKTNEEAFAPFAAQMKQLEWHDEELPYRIIAPQHAVDIVHEGHQLQHCVHSYIKDVIEGKCQIMFLRKTAEPEKPFVTLEIQNRRIQQYRGWDNETPSKDVCEFVNAYNMWLVQNAQQTAAA